MAQESVIVVKLDEEQMEYIRHEFVDLSRKLRADVVLLRNTLLYVESNLDYLARLWGREGVSQNVIDRIKETLRDTQPVGEE